MSMELLSRPYMDEFYSEDELTRLRDEQIREGLSFFPFMAMIDAFQHWVYTAPEHGAEARRAKWAELAASGYRVVVVTHRRLTRERARVSATLRRLLDLAA